MKKILMVLLGLALSCPAYATDFTDTDQMYGWDGSAQFWQTWVDHKTQIDTVVLANSAVVLNTAKVTNATHTGDVTGGTALTIAVDAVDIPMLSATGTASSTTFLRGDNLWVTPSGAGDMTAAVYDVAGVEEQVVGLTATQTLTNKTLTGSGFILNSDETNLMWDGTDTYKVHLDGIFEPLDATILKDTDIGGTVQGYDADTVKADTSTNHVGTLTATVNTLVKAANYTLTASEARGSLAIGTAAMTLTLPYAVAGYSGCFMSGQGVTAVIQLLPASGDYLVVDGVRGTAATVRASGGAAGDKICFIAADTDDWYVTSEVGTWSE